MKAFHEIRIYDRECMVWCSSYDNISYMAHWHQEWELTFVREGSMKVSIQDQQYIAKAGDLIVCPSGNIHYSDPEYMKNSLDFLLFHPSIMQSYSGLLALSCPIIRREELVKAQLFDQTRRLFSFIQEELAHKRPFFQDIVKSAVIHYWYQLLRQFGTEEEKGLKDNKRSHLLTSFQSLLEWLDEHYEENITLSFAASKMNLSESYFSRLFKKLSGENFVTYLNMVRIEKAAFLIRSSNMKVADIAYSCGYSNIRSFNRVFKELTTFTPSAYAKLPQDIAPLHYYQIKSKEGREVTTQSAALIR